MVSSRLEEQQQFCHEHGWGNADLFPLPCDASKRSYTRLIDDNNSIMLMDAPPEFENLAAYIRIGNHLQNIGIRTPEVVAYDLNKGLALVEDFGDDTFTRLLAKGESEKDLYLNAVRLLIHMQNSPIAASVDAPPYDEDLLLLEVERFIDWFVPAACGSEATSTEKATYQEAWRRALAPVKDDRSMLVVRDFHVDNLMIVGEGEALTSCGLLDFQDALIGSPAYDLVSLVEDARRDVLPETRTAVLDCYFDAFPEVDRLDFEMKMALLGAQRHAKVLGLFTRLSRQDGKHTYLKHIPRVARLLAESLKRPELCEVRQVIEALVPDFEAVEIEAPLTSLYPS